MENHLICPGWFPKDLVFPNRLFEPGYLANLVAATGPGLHPAQGYIYLPVDARVSPPMPAAPPEGEGPLGDGIWYFGAYPKTEDDMLYSPVKFSIGQIGAIYCAAKAIKAVLTVKVSVPSPMEVIEERTYSKAIDYDGGTGQIIWATSTSGGDDGKGGLTPDPEGTLTAPAFAELRAGYTGAHSVSQAKQSWGFVGKLRDRYRLRDYEQTLSFSFARHSQSPGEAVASPIDWSPTLLGKDSRAFSSGPHTNWQYAAGNMPPMKPALLWLGGGITGTASKCVTLNPLPANNASITSDPAGDMDEDPADSGKSWTLDVNGIHPDPPTEFVSVLGSMARWAEAGPQTVLNSATFFPSPPPEFPTQVRVPAGGTANWLRALGFMTQAQFDRYWGQPQDSWSALRLILGFTYSDILAAINSIGDGVAYSCRIQFGGGLGYGVMRHVDDNPNKPPFFAHYSSSGYIDQDGFFRPMFKITLTAKIQSNARGLNLNAPEVAAYFANQKTFSSDKHDFTADNRVEVGFLTAFGQRVKMWGPASEAPGTISGTVDFDGFSPALGLFASNQK
jgi:hypothetical protein